MTVHPFTIRSRLVKRQQQDGSGSTPPYGGIVIGVMALVVIVGGCFYLKRLRQRATKEQAKSEVEAAAAASAANTAASNSAQRPSAATPANRPPAGSSTGIAGSTSHDNLLGLHSQPHLRPAAGLAAPPSPFNNSFNPSTPPPPPTPFAPVTAAAYGSPRPMAQQQHQQQVHMPVPMQHSGGVPGIPMQHSGGGPFVPMQHSGGGGGGPMMIPQPTPINPQFTGGHMPQPTPVAPQFTGGQMPQPTPIPHQYSGNPALAAAMIPPAPIQTRPKSPSLPPHQYVAQFAYAPQQADELPLQPGDQVSVLKAFDDGWALVSVHGQQGSGMVPMSLLAAAAHQQVHAPAGSMQGGGMPGIANRYASLHRR